MDLTQGEFVYPAFGCQDCVRGVLTCKVLASMIKQLHLPTLAPHTNLQDTLDTSDWEYGQAKAMRSQIGSIHSNFYRETQCSLCLVEPTLESEQVVEMVKRNLIVDQTDQTSAYRPDKPFSLVSGLEDAASGAALIRQLSKPKQGFQGTGRTEHQGHSQQFFCSL